MTNENAGPANGSITSVLVVGGGISGLTAAIEAAEVGYEVYLVEKNPYLGGRVAQLNTMPADLRSGNQFPTD